MKKRVIVLFAVLVAALYAVSHSLEVGEFSLHFIAAHAREIEQFIQSSFLLSLLLYFLIYVLLLSLGMPLGAIMAMTSGFFYPYGTGVSITFISAVASALLTFLVARTTLYRYLKKRYTKRIEKIENAVNENGAYYVLAVRISSVLPFFWVNLLFGAANLSARQYILPTIIGLIPGTLVYVHMGTSLATLDSVKDIFSFKIALSLFLLGMLALTPVFVQKLRKKHPKSKKSG